MPCLSSSPGLHPAPIPTLPHLPGHLCLLRLHLLHHRQAAPGQRPHLGEAHEDTENRSSPGPPNPANERSSKGMDLVLPLPPSTFLSTSRARAAWAAATLRCSALCLVHEQGFRPSTKTNTVCHPCPHHHSHLPAGAPMTAGAPATATQEAPAHPSLSLLPRAPQMP